MSLSTLQVLFVPLLSFQACAHTLHAYSLWNIPARRHFTKAHIAEQTTMTSVLYLIPILQLDGERISVLIKSVSAKVGFEPSTLGLRVKWRIYYDPTSLIHDHEMKNTQQT